MQTKQKALHISVRDQRLTLKSGDRSIRSYPVSTSLFGLGSEEGSMRTPLGRFRIAEKIGANTPSGTIFKDRQPIQQMEKYSPDDDLMMSRILWLDGLEEHNANTRDRYIYIHGTNQEDKIGAPASHGCIRMKSADLIELFDLVDIETPVVIEA
ncbi:MAG: L,D-transpeptidase [Verrucomicrobiota bacterium]|nr:L,D-transpeptidase [Verrucomicrobiota bacterium]